MKNEPFEYRHNIRIGKSLLTAAKLDAKRRGQTINEWTRRAMFARLAQKQNNETKGE